MKDFYTTDTGIQLLTTFEQFKDGRSQYHLNEHKAIRAAAGLLLSRRLEIVAGSDLLQGLAYTSSGDFAALWNCNTSARLRARPSAYFKGIALSSNGSPVAIYQDHDNNGNETSVIFEPIIF